MKKSSKRSLIYGVGIVVIIVGLFAAGRLGGTPAAEQQATLPTSLLSGGEAADFALQDLDGNTVTLSEFREEKPVLLEFLAVWCPHCQNQTKVNKKVIETNAGRDIVFLGINASQYGRFYSIGNATPVSKEDLEWFRDKFEIEESLLFDTGSVGEKYGLTGFPMFVLIDRDGKIAWRQSGEVTATALQEQIDKVLQ